MIKFVFDEEMIDDALKANGWNAGWNSDEWSHKDDNADWFWWALNNYGNVFDEEDL